MDEREVHDLLHDAASGVSVPAGLPARAERRFVRRRRRARAVVAGVVVVVVGSAVGVAASIGRDRRSPGVVAPTSTAVAAGGHRIDGRDVMALSFVDAEHGFGVVGGAAGNTVLARTDDGGRTWRRVGALVEAEPSVHFSNRRDGVAWGNGPLEVTTDGGVRWRLPAGGPADNLLAWSGDRLWSLTPCVQTTPCGAQPLQVSDDTGVTWRTTAPLRRGYGGATVLATSRAVAYVVEPATDRQPGPWQLVVTVDGGRSWTYRSAPCATWTQQPALAAGDGTLLLVCAGEPGAGQQMKEAWRSVDGGRQWVAAGRAPGGGYVSFVRAVGETFVLGLARGDVYSSTDRGSSWQVALPTVEGFPAIDVVPGVGAWVVTGRADASAGLWFGADGVHWQRRARD